MANDVIMPQMGESIAEGTLTKWLVQIGEAVERDQPLFEISTDKVDAEIPSPIAGVLLEVKFEEGSVVQVDDVVAVIGESGEQAIAATGPVEPAAPVGIEQPAVETPSSSPVPPPQPVPSPPLATVPPPAAAAPPAASPVPETDVVERVRQFSSPLVRRMAAEKGVEMPIAGKVHEILFEGRPVRDAVQDLLSRPLKEEL